MPKKSSYVVTAANVAASGAVLMLALRVIAGPDALRHSLMKLAKGSENACQKQAILWATLADKSQNCYNSLRTVNV